MYKFYHKNLQRLKCLLGYHSWYCVDIIRGNDREWAIVECEYCGKKEIDN